MYAYVTINTQFDPQSESYSTIMKKGAAAQVGKVTDAVVTVEDAQLICHEGTETPSIFAYKIAASRFQDLPANIMGPQNLGTLAACDISYSNIGARHRCHRGDNCILTAAHEPTAECKRGRPKGKPRGGLSGPQRVAKKAASAAAAAPGAAADASKPKRPRQEGGGAEPMAT